MNWDLTSNLHLKYTLYINMLLYRYADQVRVGDEVMILRNDKLMPTKVMNVSSLIMQGNYS